MKFEMFDIVNYDSWGDLVKQWVRNEKQRPSSIKEFIEQVNAAGVGATVPAQYTDVEIIPTSSADPILRIRLPPRDLLDQAETDLGTQSYPLPPFYPYHMVKPELKTDDKPTRLLFHSKRVGEYTVKFCG
jgi:hypothetical protein